MTQKNRPNFNPAFRLEIARLVVDQRYSHTEAADAMCVGYSTLRKSVKQLREERAGRASKASLDHYIVRFHGNR